MSHRIHHVSDNPERNKLHLLLDTDFVFLIDATKIDQFLLFEHPLILFSALQSFVIPRFLPFALAMLQKEQIVQHDFSLTFWDA